jgi:hypothetical protein
MEEARAGNRFGPLFHNHLQRFTASIDNATQTRIHSSNKGRARYENQLSFEIAGVISSECTMTTTSRLQAPIPPRGLNIRQASAYWGVSPGTFKTLIRRGQAPAPTKIPGLTRNIWDRRVLDDAMDAARDDALRDGVAA